MNPQPLKRALKFLRWFCREDYLEEFEGDLIELFEKHFETSPKKAKRKFFWGVLRCFRPGFMKAFYKVNHSNTTAMFRHNLLITFRNFKKYKGSFLTNLLGLSTGLACFFLISVWIEDELSIDQFLGSEAKAFQVLQNTEGANGIETMEATPALLAKALKEEMPEVEYSTTVIPTSFNISKGVISVDEQRLKAVGQYVSSDFLNVLPYPLKYGSKNRALSNTNSVVISETLAQNLFKTPESAIGKTLEWHAQNMKGVCVVTGVLETLPANATNQFDLLLSYEWFEQQNSVGGWTNSSPRTFVKLKESTNKIEFSQKLEPFLKSKDSNISSTLFLQNYADRYLHGNYENGKPAGGRVEYVILFMTVAIFILIIACINFMNLSTARASRRTKEVGVKRTFGASRKGLVLQYLQESTLLAFLSLAIAVVLVLLLLPKFNEITGKHIQVAFDTSTTFWMLGATLFTGLISGSYPALYLSGFNPVKALNGAIKASTFELGFRKTLIIFQFSVSVILIVAVLVVSKQLAFIQNSKSAGYDRNQVIYFGAENMSDAFVAAVRNTPGVLNAGGGSLIAGNALGGTDGVQWDGKSQQIFFSTLWMSYHLAETLGMEIAEGRYFSEEFGSEAQVILNEKAIQLMGLDDPIGKNLQIDGDERQIVGIVKNFHFQSLYDEIKPCILLLAPMKYAPRLSVKIQAGLEKPTIDKIKAIYESYNPNLVFDFKFMDEDYQRLYASENRVAALSKYFTVLAILISCLGLLGLSSFMAERRMKEIGIRKVLGANLFEVLRILNGDFIKSILIALLLALPLSYLIVSEWLSSFVYRIDLQWWYFLLAGLLLIGVAWLTVSFQTIKTARTSPIKALKQE